MGNSSSSSGRGHHEESVDFGYLVPQGVYTGPRDWNQAIVSQLIVQRKLAPFYRPLEDYDDSWDDDQILAARKELLDPDNAEIVTRVEATATASKSKRPGSLKEPAKPEAQIYRGAAECPICFLYYPPNINHSRCCDQAICTECFVQIKRSEPTTTHIVSEPAACPYCVQDNFGVVYTPPSWRTGLGSDPNHPMFPESSRSDRTDAVSLTHKRRQKSFGADSPEVVTIDQIRPDWEAKLEAVRAAVARRANRRIIMRQVGDRLIPVGVTSGRIHALSPEEAAAAGAEGGGSRRRNRRHPQNGGAFEQYVGMSGQDLEELMLMEAMRLSLLEHEEHQRKQADEKRKGEAGGRTSTSTSPEGEESSSETQPLSLPGFSTLEAQSIVTPSSSSNLSLSSSIPRSSSPRPPSHRTVGSQDSLSTGRKSWSFSRSRTPPPPPAPLPNIPLSEDNSAAWRNRPSGPPAFSTLSAALTSTSTAAAVLGVPNTGSEVSQDPSRSNTPEPTLHLASSHVDEQQHSPIPTITIDGNDEPASRRTSQQQLPPIPLTTDSESSVIQYKSTAASSTSSAGEKASLAGPSIPLSLSSSETPLIDASTNTTTNATSADVPPKDASHRASEGNAEETLS